MLGAPGGDTGPDGPGGYRDQLAVPGTDVVATVSVPAIADFAGPIFVAHGTRDPLVPFSITERLVGQRPDISLFRTDAGEHLMSYATDPTGYQAALATWIAAVEARHALR